MQNGIPPDDGGKLAPRHLDLWSPEALDFLEATSGGTLEDIERHTFLKYVSSTVMIPYMEHARWDTIERPSFEESERYVLSLVTKTMKKYCSLTYNSK
ncbi:MAG: hypothetical protein M1818_000733 [Claussenomyces sp. TS43310]|nr:MAG: hypothetical protein M1818_000733 [Claussenomyces sp. TS43310]